MTAAGIGKWSLLWGVCVMSTKDRKRKRPSYPSPARQWQGIILVAITIVCLHGFAMNGIQVWTPGNILWLLTLFVTYWSGLRAGVICSALSLSYLVYVYSIPGEPFHYTQRNLGRIVSAFILFPLFTLVIGTVQNRLRNSAMRAWDATEKAESEAGHRRFAEAELKSREDLWRLVVDSSMDGIVAMGEDGNITLWNPNAEAIFGWKMDEVMGKSLGETIVPPSYRENHHKGLQRFLQTGEESIFGRRLELLGLAKDGREFPIELIVVQQQTSSGRVFIGFVRDMSEQQKLNARLRQAQKMEAVGTLAGGIAHDFNNILTAVSGNLMFVRSDLPFDHPVQVSLSEIEKAVDRATQVVRQILSFSSAREINAQALKLEPIIREALQFLQSAIPPSMEVQAFFEDNLPPIFADATDIHQIVLNLGINAYHAMGGKPGRFEVYASTVILDETTAESLLSVPPGDYVRLSIGDSGCGMDAQTLHRIFEPFFTTKAQGEGTGLGLSVVYGIVERHNGAITVYSEPNKGTVFHIYFPAAQVLESAQQSSKTEMNHQGNGERILYVDDDEALVFMMTRMLRRLNYEVTGIQHPREALDIFRSAPELFDLVITDMSMPHLDGPALVRELQAIRPDLPIVMVTGYIRPNDLEQAKDLGIRELLLKPNTVNEMSESLHRILMEIKEEDAAVS